MALNLSPSIKEAIEQQANLDRVGVKIGDVVINFWRYRIATGEEDFFINELTEYVCSKIHKTTFDSCSRILRDLRQRGVIDYELLSRSKSLYRLKRLPAKQLEII